VLVFHAKFFSDLHESSETVDVVRVLGMDVFVDFQGLIEKIHSSIARGYHKLPLYFTWLDLEGTLKIDNSFLKLVLFSMVHTEA
jgi:hypothetical protein